MSHTVAITRAAWSDLERIVDWIADHDSPESANHVLDRLLEATQSISESPFRGSRPRELPPGMPGEYRQVFFKPDRVIYKVLEEAVVIYVIADGRRHLKSLLFQRLTSE
jgi:toxin ParE1/3/4